MAFIPYAAGAGALVAGGLHRRLGQIRRNGNNARRLDAMYATYGTGAKAVARAVQQAREDYARDLSAIHEHQLAVESNLPRITDYFGPRAAADGGGRALTPGPRSAGIYDPVGGDDYQPRMILDPTMRYRRSTRRRNRALLRRFARRKFRRSVRRYRRFR